MIRNLQTSLANSAAIESAIKITPCLGIMSLFLPSLVSVVYDFRKKTREVTVSFKTFKLNGIDVCRGTKNMAPILPKSNNRF